MNFALKLYQQDKKVNQTLFLYIIYCLSLLLIRAKITQSVYLFFLIWNLFLAFVPYVMSSYFQSLDAKNNTKFKLYTLLTIWILFIPNSFYIITDLVHLDNSDGIFFWLDLIIISSYALIGFGLGLLSLTHFETTLKTIISKKYASITLFFISFLCGFGIYVGRILRYNTWDIISNPFDLIVDLFTAATSKTSLFFSIQFGIFIYFAFLIKKNITCK
jgi:uncharacterized membrane protein